MHLSSRKLHYRLIKQSAVLSVGTTQAVSVKMLLGYGFETTELEREVELTEKR